MSLQPDYDNISAILLSSNNSWKLESEYINVFKEPELTIYFINKTTYIKSNNIVYQIEDNPLDLIDTYTKKGYFAVGYIAYEYLQSTEIDLIIRQRNYPRYPEIYFNLFKSESTFDNKSLLNYSKQFRGKLYLSSDHECNISEKNRQKFISGVNKILSYIEKGDVYQVNLSHLISVKQRISPVDLFIKYYKIQPVPYAIYLKCDDFYFISGSMELFLERSENNIITKPIKGTKKKVSDKLRNIKLKNELYNNIKERAENLMIVDLMRNDLSRICKIGTVNVSKLFDIKSYNTLFQMESSISGKLKDNLSFKEIIYNVFPPGSVTGAPKRRSVQIIDELEDHNRGPYCGCAGVLRPDGGFTLSVSIRTSILGKDNNISFWAGSGIVYDSDAKSEYDETLLKCRAFFNAMV